MKIQKLSDLKNIVARHQQKGEKVVFANGCFDLLHVGHVRYLRAARALGDVLVVGVNTDTSVQALKGAGRPLMNEQDRLEILSALECVDYLLLFDDLTADKVLDFLHPNIHAKGTDYTRESVPERDTVLSYGGKIAIVGDPKTRSTRAYLRKIAESE